MSSWPVEPLSNHVWEHTNGWASISELGPHVVGVELRGHITREALKVIEPQLVAMILRSGALRMFWNAEKMTSYEAIVRDSLVKVFIRHRSGWRSANVLFSSGLIGMVVTTIGLAFKGAIKGLRDRDEFGRLMEKALAESGE